MARSSGAPHRLAQNARAIFARTGPKQPTPTAEAMAAGLSRPSGRPTTTTYLEAVALYERGLEAVQRHDFAGATGLFESVLRQYPEEKELHERVRLY